MRTPITLKIKFKSSSLDQFIERYSVDVSRGGIFIRTKEPLPVGTTLRFEFQLQDGSSLIGGEGTVVWNRAYDPGRTGVAPGMGVRFDKLTADSQRVLERILTEKHKRGEAQLESRFDAGVRASREARTHEFLDSGTPLPAPVPGLQPGAAHGGFGDEPTRMMAADQMNQLAEQMQKPEENFTDEQPTRRASLKEIQQAVMAPEASPLSPGRTGRTGEQVRLGSGASSPALARGMTMPASRGSGPATGPGVHSSKVSSMGPVIPSLANATVPAPSAAVPAVPPRDEPMPPSLSTRPVSAAQAALLIAASASESTPPKEIPEPSPAAPDAAEARSSAPTGPLPQAGVGPTLVGASVPSLRGLEKQEFPTLRSPPPAESAPFADFLSGLPERSTGAPEAEEPPAPGMGLADALASLPPPEGAQGGAEAAGHPEGAQSPISISIPAVDVELPGPSPDVPLNPQDFVLPASLQVTQESMQPLVAPDMADTITGPRLAPPPQQAEPTGGAARTVLLFLIPLLALLIAGILVYGRDILRGLSGTPVPVPETTKPEPLKTAPPPIVPAEGPKPAVPPAEAPKEIPDTVKDKEGATKTGGEETESNAVQVTTDPPGAQIELAGKQAGITPAQLKGLEPGQTYEITLSLRGYQNLQHKFKVQPSDNKPISLKLQQYERVVEINSTPRGAEVVLDGKKVGKTPLVLKKLDMNKVHQIEVRKAGFSPQTRNISDTEAFEVKNGREVLTLSLALEAGAPQVKKDREDHPARDRHETRKPDTEGKKTGGEGAEPATPEGAKPETKPEARPEGKPKEPEQKGEADKPDKTEAPAK